MRLRDVLSSVQIQVEMKYYLFPKDQRGCESNAAPNSVVIGILTQGIEVDHVIPSSAEVKNEWSCTLSPPYAFMAWILTPLPFYVVTDYCEYLVKFTKVIVVVVDSPEVKVMPSASYLISSHSSVGVKYLKRGHASLSVYDTPEGNWCEWNLFVRVVYERFNRKNIGTLCV